MFGAATFTITAIAQELWRGAQARRAVTREAWPVALATLVARNRRRYGGYAVHVGIVVLLVGVAASTTFQHVSDVRMKPGDTARVAGYDVRYVRATSARTAEKITLGAVLEVSRDGRYVATLVPSRGYYPSLDDATLGRIGRFFDGESTSELGLRAGLERDIWTAMQPDLSAVQPLIRDADRRFPDADGRLEGFIVSTVVRRYVQGAPVADFRLMVSPLVAWIWIGGVIVVGATMVALWPAPRRASRREPVASRLPGRLRRPAGPV
jgi:cytochrome c-type biogenesis protein CcmF